MMAVVGADRRARIEEWSSRFHVHPQHVVHLGRTAGSPATNRTVAWGTGDVDRARVHEHRRAVGQCDRRGWDHRATKGISAPSTVVSGESSG
jgi:hypothetical protein